jgi:hypothetical protein
VLGGVTGTNNNTIQQVYSYWNASPSGFIFSWNNSGEMQNDTWLPTESGWANTSRTLNATPGMTIAFVFFVNDTGDDYARYDDSFVITQGATHYYARDACPVSDLQTTILYIFIGLVIIGFGIFAEYSNVPGLCLIAGIICMVYSGPLYYCQMAYGLLLTIIGFVYIMWGVKWKWQRN